MQLVGLTPLQLVLAGTVLEATCFLGEIPTGVIADVFSRRLSILIGIVLIGGGLVLMGCIPEFWAIVLANVIWGIGYTFTSGATQAWITDEVGADSVQPVFTRGYQLVLAMTFIGTAGAGALGLIDLRVPILVAGAGYLLLAVVLVIVMPERNFHRTPRSELGLVGQLRRSLTSGISHVRRRPVVRTFFVISLLFGLSSEVFDRLWVARIVADFTPPPVFGVDGSALWFSAIVLLGTLISLAVSLIANRIGGDVINALHPALLLGALVVVQVLGVVGLAVFANVWLALAAMYVRDAARALSYPIQAAWLQRNVDAESRATVLSMSGQADALGQVLGGPPLGVLASRTSIPIALVVSAVILSPAALLYSGLRQRRETQVTGRA